MALPLPAPPLPSTLRLLLLHCRILVIPGYCISVQRTAAATLFPQLYFEIFFHFYFHCQFSAALTNAERSFLPPAIAGAFAFLPSQLALPIDFQHPLVFPVWQNGVSVFSACRPALSINHPPYPT